MRAVFLDRDGTLNVKAPEGEYVTAADEVVLCPGAAEAVALANERGWPVVVVTNQRCVALGLADADDVRRTNERVADLVHAASGGEIETFLVCPHGHGECDCRKPAPGLFHRAEQLFPALDLPGSVMIGDSGSDVVAAARAGVPGYLITGDDTVASVLQRFFADVDAA